MSTSGVLGSLAAAFGVASVAVFFVGKSSGAAFLICVALILAGCAIELQSDDDDRPYNGGAEIA